jgi:hypothetical protein
MEAIMRTGSLIALAFAAALGTTTSAVVLPLGGAQASPVNTGIDVGAGNVDLAWSIVGGSNSLGSPYSGPAYTVLNGSSPPPDYSGAWITNPASNWDTPTLGATGNLDQSGNGTYYYQTKFTAGVGDLSGQFAADNEVSAIFLNGTQIYTGPAQNGNNPQFYNIWTGFSGTTLNGLNTLTFDVVNYGDLTFPGGAGTANPSGLNVEFTSSVAQTPLPSTWTMLIAGFLGLGFLAYRGTKKRTALAAA